MKTSLIISWLGNSGPGIERYFRNYTYLMATAMMTCPYLDYIWSSHQSLTRNSFNAKSLKNDKDTVKEKTKVKATLPARVQGCFSVKRYSGAGVDNIF